MSCALAIFVKTPGLSPVKTRLWPALGQQAAEALYLLSAEAVASVAEQVRRPGGITPYWAVAEPAALHSDAWADLPHVGQGDGGLGERMCTVFHRLLDAHDAAMLIGADAPQLPAAELESAAQWLVSAERRLVLGRAADGGFWLVGANFPLPARVWTSVAYSSARTADDFVAAVGNAGHWAELAVLRDLDTADDLAPVADALHGLDGATAPQARLARWIDGLCSGSTPRTQHPPELRIAG